VILYEVVGRRLVCLKDEKVSVSIGIVKKGEETPVEADLVIGLPQKRLEGKQLRFDIQVPLLLQISDAFDRNRMGRGLKPCH